MAYDKHKHFDAFMDGLPAHSARMRYARMMQPKKPDPSPEHEAMETPAVEAAEHETGVEMSDEAEDTGADLDMKIAELEAQLATLKEAKAAKATAKAAMSDEELSDDDLEMLALAGG